MYSGKKLWILTLVVCVIAIVSSQNAGSNIRVKAQVEATPTPTAYSDLLLSDIRGIDAKTIAAYQKGEGAGLALPAELNGYPGPRHVLELADKLGLTEDQRQKIKALADEMLPQAIELGNQILSKERDLELAFRSSTIDENFLQQQVTSIAELQGKLRVVHLRTHLATVKILSPAQIMQYNMLRGYTTMSGDHQH